MRLKLFGHNWYSPLLVLWLLESVVTFLAFDLVAGFWFPRPADPWVRTVQTALFGSDVTLAMVAMGLFSRRLRDRAPGVVLRVSVSTLVGALGAMFTLVYWEDFRYEFKLLLIASAVAWLLVVVIRVTLGYVARDEVFKRRILVYGAGRSASQISNLRRRADQRGFRIIGYVPAADETIMVPADRIARTGPSLLEYLRREDVDEIVVAMDDRRGKFPLNELLECRLAGWEITELTSFLERETGKIYLEALSASWMIFGGGFRRDTMRRISERSFDIVASALTLVIGLPFMLLTVLAIKLEDGMRAPVLYRQQRVGLHGRAFNVLKFRSMRQDAERDGQARWATANDPRVTRVGAVIRLIRVDELPQLLNVLRGNMSFVGPRPERPKFVSELADLIPYYQVRHSVKPGLTGWAQLCYPYGASQQDAMEKLQYDLFYVKNHGLMFDIVILLQTVEVIVFGKGAR